MSSSSRSLKLIGIAVSVVSIAAVIVWASQQDAPTLPSSGSEIAWLVSAVVLYFVACAIRGERWLLLLHENGALGARRGDSYALTAVGFMGNNVLPARAGDAMRVVAMAPRAQADHRTVIGTIIAERILDVVVLFSLFVVVAFGLLNGVDLPSGDRFVLVAVVAAGAALLIGIGAFVAQRKGVLARVVAFVKPMIGATANLRGRHGAEALVATFGIWATEVMVWWMTGQAAGIDFSLLESCYLISLASILVLVPAGPGYAGTLDAALIFGVKAIGGTGADALSYLLLLRFVILVPITLAGLGALVGKYGGLRIARTAT